MGSGAVARQRHDFATVSMDTWVNLTVVSDLSRAQLEPVVQRAFEWFETVERICTRFDPSSEVMQLIPSAGRQVRVSTLLGEACGFALDLARATDGAFDPTIGADMERLGFDVDYRTGARIVSPAAAGVSFRDVQVDRRAQTVRLRVPLVLDLNAVAKGLAIDLAARELRAVFRHFCVDAGGDVAVCGANPAGQEWTVGIQHPRAAGLLARTLRVSDAAVCTSGDYERRASGTGAAHVLDGRTRLPVTDLASVTVLAPTAMAADGLSTAAMALGRVRGAAFLRDQAVSAVLVPAEGEIEEINL
jgi:thiamine biosynthesis lipoprotein